MCEERAAASAAGLPPRRRGGGRRAALGGVARQGSSSARHRRAVEGWGATRGVLGRQEVARGRPTAVGGAGQRRRRGAEQASRLEKKMRTILQFPKVPGAKL